jgi:4-diphosphocytidyl-2-C-methyl-D-erythritol kinase
MSEPGLSKLNVFLEVHARRPDGYHELETVMLRTSLRDQLTAVVNYSGNLTLAFSDATPAALRLGVPLDSANLVLRAAEALRLRCGIQDGADFVLHKRIPPQSGLGGGSGNAAAALRLCRRLWNLPLSDGELHETARTLGSDVNFLLSGAAAALCRGRGEQIQPLALSRPLWFVAARPETGNSTASVFARCVVPQEPVTADRIRELLTRGSGRGLDRAIFNRLLTAARECNSQMAMLMDRMQQGLNRPVFMTGSGSTVFVLADSLVDARRCQAAIRRQTGRSAWLLECRPDAGRSESSLILPSGDAAF